MKHIIDIETWERRDNYNFGTDIQSDTTDKINCRL